MTQPVPAHIAIIMDGNGRWAERHGFSRIRGHEAGAESVRRVCRECVRLGVRQLTLFAFSVENWKRPRTEVTFLMRLYRRYLIQNRSEVMENNIRFVNIGRLDQLPAPVQNELRKTMDLSASNTGMTLCVAINYGGRTEIVDAARRFAGDVRDGKRQAEDLDEALFSQYLYQPGMPEPDLLIRTAGEMRISNFMLWQIPYSEIWVTPVCWPEFREAHLQEGIAAFNKRVRKFGALKA